MIERRQIDAEALRGDGCSRVRWFVIDGLQPYEPIVAAMESTAKRIAAGEASEQVWLLEHPPLLTAGTSARDADLLTSDFPVHRTGRGGQFTYHGPGQRVAYVMLDLSRRGRDVRAYVAALEDWIMRTLAMFSLRAERREDRVGLWVRRPEKPALPDGSPREDKIAAIGVRLHRWVAFHGVSINVDPGLSHFDAIVPCGVRGHGVTSFEDLGLTTTIADLDVALAQTFEEVFGPLELVSSSPTRNA